MDMIRSISKQSGELVQFWHAIMKLYNFYVVYFELHPQ